MYYPVFLDLRGKKCLVIGAGSAAKNKAASLREAGAKVTLLKKKVPGTFKRYLVPFFLVVSASNDPHLNEDVFRACMRLNKLVNVVDVPSLCNFIYPSRFQQGPLQVAVSTGGASPALARHIRGVIQKSWGKNWGDFLQFFQKSRKQIFREVLDSERRRKILMNAGSPKIVSLVQKGKLKEAKREFLKGMS